VTADELRAAAGWRELSKGLDQYVRRPVMRKYLLGMLILGFLAHMTEANAQVPPNRQAVLAHGINITRWFTDPHAPEFYKNYISPEVFHQLKAAGFTYIRVPLGPSVFQAADGSLNKEMALLLVQQLEIAGQAGLGVMVQPQRQKWNLQDNPHDRELFLAFWDQFAPLLAPLDKELTFPELVNEPNFPKDRDWDDLQNKALTVIRKHLPDLTIIATGNHWSNIDGLTDTRILADKNVVYSFHFYEPSFLVSEYRSIAAEDMPAVAALPFPIADQASCLAAAKLAHSSDTQNRIKYYCSKSGWTAGKVKDLIRRAATWGQANHVPVINTELGILSTRSMATRVAWIRAVRETCDENHMGWGLWGYDDGFGFDIHPGKSAQHLLEPKILAALGLPSR
jgi:endoglucanase